MLTIAVVQPKGGVGKTTLATNLAAAAHLERRRTALIDLDRQASAFDWSANRREGSQLEGIAVMQLLQKRPGDLSPTQMAPVTRGYDVVILDGPARLDGVIQSAAVLADVVLIPVLPGPFEFWAVPEITVALDQADVARAQIGRAPVLRAFVLNRAAPGQRLTREADDAIAARGGQCVGIVRQRVAFPVAASRGESVLTSPAAADAAHDIAALWRTLKGMHESEGQPKARTRAGRSGKARGGEARRQS